MKKIMIDITHNLVIVKTDQEAIFSLFNHNNKSVSTPRDSIVPANKNLDVFGGTPTLLIRTERPGMMANIPDTVLKSDLSFSIFRN